MGPAYGTPEYRNQVDTLMSVLSVCDTEGEVDAILMDFILDHDYSRAAISEARQCRIRELS